MNGFGTLDRLVLLLLPLTLIATVAAVMILRPMSKAIADRFRGNTERLEDFETTLASLADSVRQLEEQVSRLNRGSLAVGEGEPAEALLKHSETTNPVS